MPRTKKATMSDVVNVRLKKFNMNMKSMGDNKIIVFIGKRNMGISVLVPDYSYYHQDFPKKNR